VKRQKDKPLGEPPRDRFEVEKLDYTPKVGRVRHLTLTLPKSHYAAYGMGKVDTTVTLSADEADTLADQLRAAAAELRAQS
jgi:hypothetical protein